MKRPAEAGRWLLAALAGDDEVLRTASATEGVAELRERAGDGDDDAIEALRLLVQQQTLLARINSAIADDVVVVPLRDGTMLPRADAERALVTREERRVDLVVRMPLLGARRQVRDPALHRLSFDAAEDALLPATTTTTTTTTTAFLRAFLTRTADAVPAVIEALSKLGHVEIDGALALERALDLPIPALVNDDVLVELVRLTRGALHDADAARLQRRTAPRSLRGQIVVDEQARLLVAPTLRATAHRQQLVGVGALYGFLAGVTDVGSALGLLLSSVPVRRAIEVSVKDAAFIWRHSLCASVIEARLQAAVAVAVAEHRVDADAPARDDFFALRDECRVAARSAVGFDPGAEVVDELLAPPWPDGLHLRSAREAQVSCAVDAASTAQHVGWLRDTVDEGVLLRRHGLEPLRELWQPPSAATTTTPPAQAGEAAGAAWAILVGEVL